MGVLQHFFTYHGTQKLQRRKNVVGREGFENRDGSHCLSVSTDH